MREIKKKFHGLSSVEKFLTVSLIFSFLFTFFSWFYQANITGTPNADGKYEEIISFNAYEGISAVTGYFYALFILTAIALIFLSLKDKTLASFLDKRPWFFLFLTGQSLFLLVITFLIYSAYSLQFTRASIEIGLVLSIISNLIAVFSAHFYYLQKKKIIISKKFTEQMQNNIHLQSEDIQLKSETEKRETEDRQMSLADYESIKT